ncbi:unnamed protein product [Penicillium roqueforti FM164]|uniref:Genomic scaffold, ProqFM164S02 n=1 Tax=Penicillium roqueforti (strain FM164) TaxID=1365484 RepID=W6QUN8_PENRF|nr:unnamed protein product [Penicillium roqueforti FM164]
MKETTKPLRFPVQHRHTPKQPPRIHLLRSDQELPRRLAWQLGHPADDAVWLPRSAPNVRSR